MTRPFTILVVAATVGLAACGGSTGRSASQTTVAGPTTTAVGGGIGPLPGAPVTAGPARTCNLPTTPSLIERDITPNGPPIAVLIGNANVILCEPTVQAFRQSVPSLPGYCSQLAPYSANPTYDVNAVPAPPLQGIVAQDGSAC